jgi:uncharacterized heparinase superfamily protein
MVGMNSFRFLNEIRTLKNTQSWNDPQADKLWLYNLHYFDDLNAENAAERKEWHEALLSRWVAENPSGTGNGWEPYPSSLRIVNWIKWALAGNVLPKEVEHSLAVQVRYLKGQLEYHLLGNHLFANAKALVFAGAFFQGPEAEVWMRTGLGILRREILEQILADGGQFERSPMYHALALEDMCDLINIVRAYPESVPAAHAPFISTWPVIVSKMIDWLETMCHPDGEIALFNDAAFGIAPQPNRLLAYCEALNISGSRKTPKQQSSCAVTHLDPTGYIRVEQVDSVAFLDCAPIGPDYLPGHAHADTLSFELSLFGRRVIVDSGTSCYGIGTERLRQRGTAAHNTVVIDNKDSSEVWSGFRVARRAYPHNLSIAQDDTSVVVSCGHDGYTRFPGKPIHARQWHFKSGSLQIDDKVKGPHTMTEARFHLHPDVLCKQIDPRTMRLMLSGGERCMLTFSAHQIELEKSSYHPEFGISLPCVCISVSFTGELTTSLTWT